MIRGSRKYVSDPHGGLRIGADVHPDILDNCQNVEELHSAEAGFMYPTHVSTVRGVTKDRRSDVKRKGATHHVRAEMVELSPWDDAPDGESIMLSPRMLDGEIVEWDAVCMRKGEGVVCEGSGGSPVEALLDLERVRFAGWRRQIRPSFGGF